MLEKDMEELIAQYPLEFFPRKKLILKDRQRTFSGVGRFDLMFSDEFGTNILMELKARTAKYEDATQLAKYLDALKALGEKNIIMWLVAPQIPNSVREFLDNIGIEYSEIHISEYRRIADLHNYKFQTDHQKHVDIIQHNKTPKQIKYGRRNTTYQSSYRSKIQGNYRIRRDNLFHTFKAGYNFLIRTESNTNNIWLGTSTNVHLYLRNFYLSYIVIGNKDLIFRARFNNQIYAGTVDKSEIMFSEYFIDLIRSFSGFKNGWVVQYGENFVFNNSTPEELFTKLFEYISDLKIK